MSRKLITIASILLLIISIVIGIGIGIGIASAHRLNVAEYHNATVDHERDLRLKRLVVRGGLLLHRGHLKELAAAKHQVLQLDSHNL